MLDKAAFAVPPAIAQATGLIDGWLLPFAGIDPPARRVCMRILADAQSLRHASR